MKKGQAIIIWIGLFLLMHGCAKNDGRTAKERKAVQVEQALVTCDPSAPRVTLAVMDFEVKAGHNAKGTLADGLSDMLVNALVETQCFRVVERSRMKDLLREQGLGLGGTVDASSAAEVGKMTGAQMLVMGTVTEFEEDANNSTIPLPFAGKLSIGTAHVGLQIRIVDSSTGVIMTSKSVNKKAKKFGIEKRGRFGSGGFCKSSSMQNAVEQAIIETVAIIASQKEMVAPSAGFASSGPSSPSPPVATDCSRIASPTGPRFMVVIPEIHIRRKVPDPAGETEIIRLFIENGFNVVDQKQIAAIRYQEKVLNAVKNTKAAVALGAEFGADIIVVGEAFSEFAGRRENMLSCRARVEAKAIQTGTGKILAANGTHAGGADISELVAGKTALRNAGTELGDYFIAQICKNSQTLTGSGASASAVEIQITNINFRQLNRFSSMLKSRAGVQNVSKQLTGNTARIQTQFAGNAEELATLLTERNNSGLRFDITGLSGNKIMLTVTGESAIRTKSSRNDMVRQIQENLTKLGYDPGTADGKMGRKTRAAIKAYQRDVGMTADGKATNSLLESVRSQL